MNYSKYERIMSDTFKGSLVWTLDAEYCKDRNCCCTGCYMKDMMETECMMKYAVLGLVSCEVKGKSRNRDKRTNEEEIKRRLNL